jgi:hypothetical protein
LASAASRCRPQHLSESLTVHFYEIAPADEESRIELDEYFVEGQFVRQVTDAQLALAESHAFEPK